MSKSGWLALADFSFILGGYMFAFLCPAESGTAIFNVESNKWCQNSWVFSKKHHHYMNTCFCDIIRCENIPKSVTNEQT